MRRAYKWTYLYAAVEPTTGESFCLYLPGMDDICLEVFLDDYAQEFLALRGIDEPVVWHPPLSLLVANHHWQPPSLSLIHI